MSRTNLLIPILISLFTFSLSLQVKAQAQSETTDPLPIAINLEQFGLQALKQNLPIAILFSGKGLKSTEKLKDEALYPILLSKELNGFALFTEIQVNDKNSTIDFYGEQLDNIEFKALYNVTSLPAVIFVNGEGDVITEQLLSGAYDYYHFYLKQSLNSALKALNNPKRVP